ncbi:MAG: hypothetical protein KR126chlam2_01056 [Chlamydiae bacterium]|nr:hypothetical protein [Chlamydiota bacterium]
MKQYYFLASLLPHLEIGHVPALGYPEFKEFLSVNMSDEGLERIKRFLRLVDIENLRALWTGEPIDPRGNLNQEELEQAVIELSWPGEEEFPDYLREFLQKYHSNEEKADNFYLLMSRFLEDEKENESGFLKEYFNFEREWRLVMVGFRAKKLGKRVEVELQFEDPTDPIVAQILAQKDAKFYEPPFEYKELKPIFEEFANAPVELHRALYEYRFDLLQDFFGSEIFSLDRILGYAAQLLIIEKWLELNVQKGIEIIDRIEEGVQ